MNTNNINNNNSNNNNNNSNNNNNDNNNKSLIERMLTLHAENHQKLYIQALDVGDIVVDPLALHRASNGWIVALERHSLVEAYTEERSKSHRREKGKFRVSIGFDP